MPTDPIPSPVTPRLGLAAHLSELRTYRRVQIPCGDRDEALGDKKEWTATASLTDIDGEFGEPHIYTRWEHARRDYAIEDYRWPSRGGTSPDVRPCEHWAVVNTKEPTDD